MPTQPAIVLSIKNIEVIKHTAKLQLAEFFAQSFFGANAARVAGVAGAQFFVAGLRASKRNGWGKSSRAWSAPASPRFRAAAKKILSI